MYHLYILQSLSNNKFYVGSTRNLSDRLIRHNTGRSKATKTGIPWKLVHSEEFETRSETMKREVDIKAWKNHTMIENLIAKNKSTQQ